MSVPSPSRWMIILCGSIIVLVTPTIHAQPWVEMMARPDANLFEVIKAYEDWYAVHPFVKNEQTQAYKRWVRQQRLAVDANGHVEHDVWTRDQDVTWSKERESKQGSTEQWRPVGPFTWDKDAAGIAYAPGLAHCWVVKEHPVDTAIVWAGTATAGLWKSTNAGRAWSNVTASMAIAEVRAIAVDPVRPDRLAFGCASGLWITNDGGASWQATGLTDDAFSNLVVYDCAFVGGSGILAATSRGLLHSSNGGISFTTLTQQPAYELEQHPRKPEQWYAVVRSGESCSLLRSRDGGARFSVIGNGLPTPNQVRGEHSRRWEIAVTPAAPDRLYLLAAGVMNGGEGLVGVYVSNDEGATFTHQCCGDGPGGPADTVNTNVLHWDTDGAKDGGQYYYDLALAVSPTDANRVYVGGINVWVSTNGGRTFTCNAHWTWGDGRRERYTHADVHEITVNRSRVWVASDGGAFFSSNQLESTQDRSYGIVGTEFWGWGQGFTDCDVMLGGTYHNGVLLKDGNVYQGWHHIHGGDNNGGLVKFSDDRDVYANVYLGEPWQKLRLTGSRDVAPERETMDIKPIGDIVTHPLNSAELWAGTSRGLERSTDDGRQWHLVASFSDSTVRQIVLPAGAPNRMFVRVKKSYWDTFVIYRSDDGGASFRPLPIPAELLRGNGWRLDHMTCTHDGSTLIVAVGGRGDEPSILRSDDGGESWFNWSDGLPPSSSTAVFVTRSRTPTVYAGTETGVYSRALDDDRWTVVGAGLPFMRIVGMSLCERSSMLRVAGNRGVWEVQQERRTPPVAIPSSPTRVLYCTRDVARFFDHSAAIEANVRRQWEFPGGNPASSTEREPNVRYDKPGAYPVRLTVVDALGTHTTELDSFIVVLSTCSPSAERGEALRLNGRERTAVAPAVPVRTRDFTMTAWIFRDGPQRDYAGIVFARAAGTATGISIGADNRLRYHAGDAGWWIVPPDTVPDRQWCHVALSVKGDSAWLAVDGRGTWIRVRHPDTTSMGAIQFGRDPFGGRTFVGALDEVRIYGRSLSETEIREAMYLTNPDTVGLRAWWQFNEGAMVSVDRMGTHHAMMADSMETIASQAPLAWGRSQHQIVLPGVVRFDSVGLAMTLPAAASEGSIVVTRFTAMPFSTPNGAATTKASTAMICDVFGTDSLPRPSELTISSIDIQDVERDRPAEMILSARPPRAPFQGPWLQTVGQAVELQSGSARFVGGLFFTSSAQLVLSSRNPLVSVAEPVLSATVGLSNGTLMVASPTAFMLTIVDLGGRTLYRASHEGEARVATQPWTAGVVAVRIDGPAASCMRLVTVGLEP